MTAQDPSVGPNRPDRPNGPVHGPAGARGALRRPCPADAGQEAVSGVGGPSAAGQG
ncbi:hypothetical protein [Streptomyces sp. NPDC002540]